MNLVVCPNRLFAIYMLAFVKQFGNAEKFHFVICNSISIPKELRSAGEELEVEFIDERQSQLNSYDRLFIHSYFKLHLQQRYVSTFSFKELYFFADGLRGGFYGLPELDNRLKGLIYFGFVVKEDSFFNLIHELGSQLLIRTVLFTEIKNIWIKVQSKSNLPLDNLLSSRDLLLVMRYWGVVSHQYRFKENLDIYDYLRGELSKYEHFDRIVLRKHPHFPKDIEMSELKRIVPESCALVLWEDIVSVDKHFPELTEPESILMSSANSPGLFLGFDSSLNIVVSKLHPQTQIIWPDTSKLQTFFRSHHSLEIVNDQVKLMSNAELCADNEQQPVQEFSIRGVGMQTLLTRLILNEFVQERDALTQERDALTQERDALRNSTIWRATRALRFIVSKFKH